MNKRGETFEFVDGRRVEPTILSTDHVIHEHVGGIIVQSGRLRLLGRHQGSLVIESGSTADIDGVQQGSLTVAAGATVKVRGYSQGSATVEHGGTLVIERGGQQQGSLDNEGLVILRGRRGGSQTGKGELRIDGGSFVEPTIENGVTYYRW